MSVNNGNNAAGGVGGYQNILPAPPPPEQPQQQETSSVQLENLVDDSFNPSQDLFVDFSSPTALTQLGQLVGDTGPIEMVENLIIPDSGVIDEAQLLAAIGHDTSQPTFFKCGSCGEQMTDLHRMLEHVQTVHPGEEEANNDGQLQPDPQYQYLQQIPQQQQQLLPSVNMLLQPSSSSSSQQQYIYQQHQSGVVVEEEDVDEDEAAAALKLAALQISDEERARLERLEQEMLPNKRIRTDDEIPPDFTNCHVMIEMLDSRVLEVYMPAYKAYLDQAGRSSGRRVRCRYCDKAFYDKELWAKHMDSHVDKGIIEGSPPPGAEEDDDEVTMFSKRRKGMASRSKRKVQLPAKLQPAGLVHAIHKCPHCDAGFMLSRSLDRHLQDQHPNLPPPPPPSSKKAAAAVRKLQQQQQKQREEAAKNEDEVSFPCAFCDRIFLTSYGLERHVKLQHPGQKLPSPPPADAVSPPKTDHHRATSIIVSPKNLQQKSREPASASKENRRPTAFGSKKRPPSAAADDDDVTMDDDPEREERGGDDDDDDEDLNIDDEIEWTARRRAGAAVAAAIDGFSDGILDEPRLRGARSAGNLGRGQMLPRSRGGRRRLFRGTHGGAPPFYSYRRYQAWIDEDSSGGAGRGRYYDDDDDADWTPESDRRQSAIMTPSQRRLMMMRQEERARQMRIRGGQQRYYQDDDDYYNAEDDPREIELMRQMRMRRSGQEFFGDSLMYSRPMGGRRPRRGRRPYGGVGSGGRAGRRGGYYHQPMYQRPVPAPYIGPGWSSPGGGRVGLSFPDQCRICEARFRSFVAYESHMKAHDRYQSKRDLGLLPADAPSDVACHQCKLCFVTELALSQHRNITHHEHPVTQCRECGARFSSTTALLAHKDREHRRTTTGSTSGRVGAGNVEEPDATLSGPKPCSVCNVLFSTLRNLQNHMFIVHGLQDEQLNRDALAEEQLRRGQNRGATAGTASTTVSGAAVAAAADDGGRMPDGSCRSKCEDCGEVLLKPSALIEHMKVKHQKTDFSSVVETHGMPPFRIDVKGGKFQWTCCEQTFVERGTFVAHRREAHGAAAREIRKRDRKTPTSASNEPPISSAGPFRCVSCPAEFSHYADYRHHAHRHAADGCFICKMTFGTSNLELAVYHKHMQQHVREGYAVARGPDPTKQTSDDEVSIFSESGVESEAGYESDSDAEDTGHLITCPMCERRFACMFRFKEHWRLHCRSTAVKNWLSTTSADERKCKAYDFRKSNSGAQKCQFCQRSFLRLSTLRLHLAGCRQKLAGSLIDNTTISGGGSGNDESDRDSGIGIGQHHVTNVDDFLKHTSTGGGDEKEDAMDVDSGNRPEANKKQKFAPKFVSKAYVIECFDDIRRSNSQLVGERQYKCVRCQSKFDDLATLFMHINQYITHPITRSDTGTGKSATLSATSGSSATGTGDGGSKSSSSSTDTSTTESTVTAPDETSAPAPPDVDDEKEPPTRAMVIQIRTGNRDTLETSASAAEASTLYKCQQCLRRFTDRATLSEHQQEHQMGKKHRCEVCRKRFWTAAGLKKHCRRHQADQNFCQFCEKKFISLETLQKHQQAHELANSLYQCEDCSKSFNGQAQLKRHFIDAHPAVQIRSCPLCLSIHVDRHSLRRHLHLEHRQARHRCAVCRKSFVSPLLTSRHFKRMHVYGNLKCGLCWKYFGACRRQWYTMHLWRHTQSAGYQCRICDRAFVKERDLRNHIEQKHIGCDLDSTTVDNWMVFGNSQDKLESAEKWFTCWVCGVRLGSKTQTIDHFFNAHRPYQQCHHPRNGAGGGRRVGECDFCPRSFISDRTLEAHRKRTHADEILKGLASGTTVSDSGSTGIVAAVSDNVPTGTVDTMTTSTMIAPGGSSGGAAASGMMSLADEAQSQLLELHAQTELFHQGNHFPMDDNFMA